LGSGLSSSRRIRTGTLVSWGSGSITHGSTPKPAPETVITSVGNAGSVRSMRRQALGAAGRLALFTGRGILEFMNSKKPLAMKIQRALKGMGVRIISALRCLRGRHFILVTWSRCEDGDLDFRISHKGVELPEAVHRLKVDAVEILQDKCDEETALMEVNSLVNKPLPNT